MLHEIKIQESYYEAVLSGDKTFEIRYNDRGYQKGDMVRLTPVYQSGTRMPGRKAIEAEVTYVTGYHQHPDWVVFGIRLIK